MRESAKDEDEPEKKEEKEEKENPDEPTSHPEEKEKTQELPKMEELVQVGYSSFYSHEERAHDEVQYLCSVKTSGLLGLGDVDLSNEKIEKLKMAPEAIPTDVIEKMKRDGLYVKEEPGAAINRLEQRLLREDNLAYFNENGMLKLHNNILSEAITRPTDASLETNPSFKTKLANAFVSQRINRRKTQFYLINIQLGKLIFTQHPLFTEEDRLVVKLKEYFADYVQRTLLSLIPFLTQRVDILSEELSRKQSDPDSPLTDIEFLEKSLKESQDQLEEEKGIVQNMAKKLYESWTELKALRASQGYVTTAAKLVVKEVENDRGEIEYEFALLHVEPEKVNITTDEKARRENIANFRVSASIYVNDQFVATTKDVGISFPNFEADFAEQIRVYVLTRPSNIKVELNSNIGVFAVVRTEPPGESVRTLTSTSSLIRKLDFASPLHGGFVFFRALWVGTGPKMPPKILTSADSMLSTEKKEEEQKRLLDDQELKEELFDVESPENDWKLALLKKLYDRYIQELLKRDMLLPLHDIEPARFKILRYRKLDPELKDIMVPLLEEEVLGNPKFLNIISMLRNQKLISKFNVEEEKESQDDENVGEKRKQDFFITLRQRQQEARSGASYSAKSPQNVIEEMEVDLKLNFIGECCSALFTPRRKLKPIRKEKEGVKGETLSQSKIIIHIIKGHNIPVRSESAPVAKKIQEYEDANLMRQDLPQSSTGARPDAPQMDKLKGMRKFIPPPQIIRVESYIEVRLVTEKGTTLIRTQEIEGVHPDWNEILELVLTPKDGEYFKTKDISNSRDMLYFSLFDEKKTVGGEYGQETIKRERRFLGSFSIPLITVFQNPPRMEATIKINRPSLVLGYYTSVQNLFSVIQDNTYSKQGLNPEIPTFVTVCISLDPSIVLPATNEFEYYPGYEDIKLLIQGTKWVKERKSDDAISKRIIQLFAENVKGESVFTPRFICPQKPPESVVNLVTNPNSQYAIEKVVRFVSLIPFVSDSQSFDDLPDMWCTSQEFLDIIEGDYEEHAVLLCNYMNYIDQHQGRKDYQSYLAIGRGIPEGITSYVIRRNKVNNHVEIWNPVLGEVYFFANEVYDRSFLCIPCGKGERVGEHDPTCPLKEIGCVISSENVYVNIQPSGDPSTLFFNIDNPAYWKPFLSDASREKYFPLGIKTVQENELLYLEPKSEHAAELQQNIQNFIAKKFEEARSKRVKGRLPMRTKWKHEVSDHLQGYLFELEKYKCDLRIGGRNSTLQALTKAQIKQEEDTLLDTVRSGILDEVKGGRDIFGFPLNMTYKDVNEIWEEVKSTDLHNVPDENAEFILSVIVSAYPSNVYSVWIYIAAIVDSPDSYI